MTAQIQPRSLLQDVLDVYDSWGAQVIVYIAALAISLGSALLLDLRFRMAPGRVLAYVLPFTAASLILLPAIFFALRRSTFIQTLSQSMRDVANPLADYRIRASTTMTNPIESTGGDDISEITRRQIIVGWHAGMTPREIAEETNVPTKVVYRTLKQAQKAIAGDGGEHHAKEDRL